MSSLKIQDTMGYRLLGGVRGYLRELSPFGRAGWDCPHPVKNSILNSYVRGAKSFTRTFWALRR